ncbi:WXG100 family type VII secretion target [Dactylosporangium sucinum]|uniref:ESAT-6-like protein n=1 Tax=Dactylosporangium sucinum TaxID=1424081 RepID=A0A917SZH9_9ACTN|nr:MULTISPECIES: WXG100 family type VII secretion target [Dactylosporangium]WVK86660.1 WXG100 family type VII secretion target [Dactylosporangium sp. AC04546]GGM03859.1 hypothetical protein GCM10007977_001510 [Dactylosporangium sucinum]
MSQPTYAINPAQVQGVVQDILSSGSAIQGQLDELHSALQNYLQLWTGQDQDAYAQYKLSWNNLINEMVSILTTQAAPALDRIVQNILNTENTITKMW